MTIKERRLELERQILGLKTREVEIQAQLNSLTLQCAHPNEFSSRAADEDVGMRCPDCGRQT